VHRLHGASQRPARSLTALLSHPQSVARECLCGTAESSHPNHGDIRCIHSRCIAAILDSTRNIIILTADERVFELPVGFSERLHARIDLELQGTAAARGYKNEPCKM
jgi:hypothetical protein